MIPLGGPQVKEIRSVDGDQGAVLVHGLQEGLIVGLGDGDAARGGVAGLAVEEDAGAVAVYDGAVLIGDLAVSAQDPVGVVLDGGGVGVSGGLLVQALLAVEAQGLPAGVQVVLAGEGGVQDHIVILAVGGVGHGVLHVLGEDELVVQAGAVDFAVYPEVGHVDHLGVADALLDFGAGQGAEVEEHGVQAGGRGAVALLLVVAGAAAAAPGIGGDIELDAPAAAVVLNQILYVGAVAEGAAEGSVNGK